MDSPLPPDSSISKAANPYAPPKATLKAAQAERVDMERYGPASKGKRFLNYLIDQLGQFGLGFGIALLLIYLQELGWEVELGMEEGNRLHEWLWGAVVGLFYYSLFEALFGRTPAKWITGTKVVNLDGTKPGLGQILGRTLSRLVPFEPFSFLGGGESGWHDRWSDTLVVDLRNEMQGRLPASLRKFYR